VDKETIKMVTAALAIVASSNATGFFNAYNTDDSFTIAMWHEKRTQLMNEVRGMRQVCFNNIASMDDEVHDIKERMKLNEFRITDCLDRTRGM